jgi:hypothetical protein
MPTQQSFILRLFWKYAQFFRSPQVVTADRWYLDKYADLFKINFKYRKEDFRAFYSENIHLYFRSIFNERDINRNQG